MRRGAAAAARVTGAALLYLWQLPQNLLGLAVIAASRAHRVPGMPHGIAAVYATGAQFGVSLGRYIIVSESAAHQPGLEVVRHEHGHQVQSRRLGWLYLVLIGLPSAAGNLWDSAMHRSWSSGRRIRWYYGLPWERSADRLGGVNR